MTDYGMVRLLANKREEDRTLLQFNDHNIDNIDVKMTDRQGNEDGVGGLKARELPTRRVRGKKK